MQDVTLKIEPKDKLGCKAQISHIDWSNDGRFVCASYKVDNIVVVWNVLTCHKVFEFVSSEHNFGNISKAYFYSLDANYLQISGDKAIILHIPTKNQVLVSNSQGLEIQNKAEGGKAGNIKKKGVSIKQCSYILKDIHSPDGQRKFVLVDNTSKLIILL